jgi:hypothetical protein
MPEFLAETYAPRGGPDTDTTARRAGEAELAAGQAPSAGAVRAAMTRACCGLCGSPRPS